MEERTIQTLPAPPATLAGIEELCKAYAGKRERLAETVEAIRAEQRRALRKRRRALRLRAAEAAAARAAVREAVAAHPELFQRPRLQAFEGVQVGYRKQQGRLECDEARTIARIRRKLPEKAAELVKVRESLDKTAVRKLDAKTLAAIGAAVVAVDDKVVVAAARDELDKLVEALAADDEAAEAEERAAAREAAA